MNFITQMLLEIAFYFVLTGFTCPRALPHWWPAIQYPTSLFP